MAKNATQNTDQNVDTSQADQTTGGDNTEGAKVELPAGFDWLTEDEAGRGAADQSKYDWEAFPAPMEIDGSLRKPSKTYLVKDGYGMSKTVYGSYKTYTAKIAKLAEEAKAYNTKVAAENEKLPEGDPSRKALKDVPVVPEFTNSVLRDGKGKDAKEIGTKVIRHK